MSARHCLTALALIGGMAAQAEPVAEVTDGAITARFDTVVSRYGHNVLGDVPEWSRLCVEKAAEQVCVSLPETAIFEDIQPRLSDIDGDGQAEIIVVESTVTAGASLVIYDWDDSGALRRTATPPIGQRNRWLAPVGAADLDGDGRIELAYVETPHIGGILKIWRWRDGGLEAVVRLRGVSNHRIGDGFIRSKIRDCGNGPEILLPDQAWSRLISMAWRDGAWTTRDLGPLPTSGDQGTAC